jgi:uncharacterized membrane protein YccC
MYVRLTTRLQAAVPDIARGLRAATVTLVPFYFAARTQRPELSWTALAGWLGTLADPGGSRRTRVGALAAFGAAGAALVLVMEVLAPVRPAATLGLAAAAFGLSLLRAPSGAAGNLGTLLAVVAAVASVRARTTPLRDAPFFLLGAAQALVLSSVVWPVWTHGPVRQAVAAVYRRLAAYTLAVVGVVPPAPPATDRRWSTLVRIHHRGIRDAIEAARAATLAVRARREGETMQGGMVRAALGAAERQFPLLGTLVEEIEALPPAERAAPAARLPAIAEAYHDMETRLVRRAPPLPAVAARRPAPQPAQGAPVSALASTPVALAARIEDAIHQAAGMTAPPPAPTPAAATSSGAPSLALRGDVLSIRSVFFQHAVRSGCATLIASALGAALDPRHAYWVTLTALAVLQPYAGATIRRAGERVLGTVLGCVAAVAITTSIQSPAVLGGLLVPLSIAAVATRPRSYRLFTFFLTPVFVLVAERHLGDWRTAAERATDSLVGGAVALVVTWLVFPSSERERLPDALAGVFDALATYGRTVLDELALGRGPGAASLAEPRRRAGIAFGSAETSLERFLAEPLRDQDFAADVVLLLTYTRRLAAALTSLATLASAAPREESGAARDALAGAARAVSAYVGDVLDGAKACVREGPRTSEPPPAPDLALDAASPLGAALDRIERWASLVATVAWRPRAAGD